MSISKKSQTQVKVNKKSIWKDHASWSLLLLCIPAIVGYIAFHYIPLFSSIVIPFKDYKFSRGIFASEWVGLKNFKWIISSPGLLKVMRNTVVYGAWFLIIEPIFNMTVALLLFEIKSNKALKVYQTIIAFPNFMSFVIVGYITYAILSPTSGVLNSVLTALGNERIDVYMSTNGWPLIFTVVHLWKYVGMGSMMYFASLVGSDAEAYEAAEIDGASRFQKMRYLSIPHLSPLYCISVIMGAGSLVGGEFDMYYIIPRDSAVLYPVTDVLSTYVYRALQQGSYSMGATVGLAKGVVGMLLVVGANLIVKKISPENSMF